MNNQTPGEYAQSLFEKYYLQEWIDGSCKMTTSVAENCAIQDVTNTITAIETFHTERMWRDKDAIFINEQMNFYTEVLNHLKSKI